jgi:hypothetical protein
LAQRRARSGRPGFVRDVVRDNPVTADRIATEGELIGVSHVISNNTQQPICEHFARPHPAELLERLARLEVVAAAANEAL